MYKSHVTDAPDHLLPGAVMWLAVNNTGVGILEQHFPLLDLWAGTALPALEGPAHILRLRLRQDPCSFQTALDSRKLAKVFLIY